MAAHLRRNNLILVEPEKMLLAAVVQRGGGLRGGLCRACSAMARRTAERSVRMRVCMRLLSLSGAGEDGCKEGGRLDAAGSATRVRVEGGDKQGSQRWVGRYVKPTDAVFTVLPWGFVPQSFVKEKVVPEALRRRDKFDTMGLNEEFLNVFGSSKQEMAEGSAIAYQFVAEQFCKGEAVFEDQLSDTIEPNLGALYDLQLRQLNKDNCLVEVHQVHDIIVTSVFPLLLEDTTSPESLKSSTMLFKMFGVTQFTARLHYLRRLYREISNGLFFNTWGGNLCLAAEVVIRTSETCRFGPNRGQRMDDCEHVLWFHGGRGQNLMHGDIDFKLANVNESLSMLQDVDDPDEWASGTPVKT